MTKSPLPLENVEPVRASPAWHRLATRWICLEESGASVAITTITELGCGAACFQQTRPTGTPSTVKSCGLPKWREQNPQMTTADFAGEFLDAVYPPWNPRQDMPVPLILPSSTDPVRAERSA